VASVQTHRVVQSILSLRFLLVAGIGDPSVGLEENRWAEIFLAVPPVRWAGCAAASAENAFVEPVQFPALGWGLAVLTTICRCSVSLQIRFDTPILLIEQRQIRNQVLDDIGVRQRIDLRFLGRLGGNATQARKRVHAVNVHCTAAADAFSAAAPERECGVQFVLDTDESIQHHGSRLVEVQLIRLHLGLG